MDKIKVLIIPKDRDIKNTHRIVKPHLYLQEQFNEEFFIDIDFEPELDNLEYLKQYDIIVYHEYLDNSSIVTDRFKDLGIIGILDIDDNWSINKNYSFYKYVKHQEEAIKNVIRNADYITTSTKPMYDKIKALVPNTEVAIISDGIDTEDKQYNEVTQPSDKLRFGLIADEYSIEDIKKLTGVTSKLKSDKVLDKMQIVLCGFTVDSYKNVKNPNTGESERIKKSPKETTWYEYEKILTNNYSIVSDEYRKHLMEFKDVEFPGIDDEPYRRVWERPTNKYGTYYGEFDVTLAPMDTNPYNATRSPFKVMESGFYKKPIIAQDFGLYKDLLINAFMKGGLISFDGNAFLVEPRKNHKDWYKSIKKLVTQKTAVLSLGENLYQTVKNDYDLNNITKLRKEFYEKLANKTK